MTKTEKEVTKGYIINGFKHFTQLATEYFPNHASCSSARKSMREKIDENLSIFSRKGRLHRAYHHPKPEDAANHLGALGTSSHFTAGQLPQRIA